MRNGIPFAYSLYRALWTVLHVGLVALGVTLAVLWFLHDNQGVDLSLAIWTTLTEVQTTVANVIPFPWGL